MEKRVFLIDDESALRRSLSLGLMQQGYDTEPCENGLKALKTLEIFKQKQTHPDYVVLDLKLPDIDGLKLLKVIRHNYPNTPIVIITGYGKDSIAEKAKLEDADGFLEKPFSVDDLTKMLQALPVQEARTERAIAPELKDAQKTVSMYAMLRLDENANLMNVYRDLYFHENVLYCDATKGEFDLVLLLQADSAKVIEDVIAQKIKTTPGVVDVMVMPVEPPMIEESMNTLMAEVDAVLGRDKDETGDGNKRTSRGGASSYVLIEIEREKFETVFPSLYFNDQVVYCDCIKGKYDIVLLMKGTSFDDIDAVIRASIKPLDGVLKIKECPIINFFEN